MCARRHAPHPASLGKRRPSQTLNDGDPATRSTPYEALVYRRKPRFQSSHPSDSHTWPSVTNPWGTLPPFLTPGPSPDSPSQTLRGREVGPNTLRSFLRRFWHSRSTDEG